MSVSDILIILSALPFLYLLLVTLVWVSRKDSLVRLLGGVDCPTKSRLGSVIIYNAYSTNFTVDMDCASEARGHECFDVHWYVANRIGSSLLTYQLGVF